MPTCASCGCDTTFQADSPSELCRHHASSAPDDWAASNRAICDGLHRQRWPAPAKHIDIELDPTRQIYPATTSDSTTSAFWD